MKVYNASEPPAVSVRYPAGDYLVTTPTYSSVRYSIDGDVWWYIPAGRQMIIHAPLHIVFETVAGAEAYRVRNTDGLPSIIGRFDMFQRYNPTVGMDDTAVTLPYDCKFDMFAFKFDCDASVGDRYVFLEVKEGATILYYIPVGTKYTANYSVNMLMTSYTSEEYTDISKRVCRIPLVHMKAGWTFQLRITGVKAGDQLSDIKYILLRN